MLPNAETRDFRIKTGLHAAFRTPILVHQFEAGELEENLKELVLEKERTEPGVGLSNVGGWHSNADLLNWDSPHVITLRDRIDQGAATILDLARNQEKDVDLKMKLGAWANVSRKGAYNSIHNHAPALFSGVYYVTMGEPQPPESKEGLLEFVDPRPGTHSGALPTHIFNPSFIVDPKPGMLIMFPGWLLHFVHPYSGESPRISIAFNLTLANN